MLREYLSNIADKFRTYLDTAELINAQDFAGKVEDVAVRYNQLGFTIGYNLGLEVGKPLGKLELLQNSEYMNAKVSGTAIAVNDVSPIEHSVGCGLGSKNLIPYSRFSPTKTINGITFTNNGDGSITLNGTATAEAIFACIDETKAISLKAGTYTLIGGLNSNIWLHGKIVEDDNFSTINQDRAVTFTFTENVSFRFNIRVSSGTVCENVVIKPQLELGTTATAYTPYVEELGGIEVSRYGKNLFDIDTVLPSFINDYGEAGEWIKQSDGSYYKGNVGTGYGDVWFENKANYKGQIAISIASKHTITEVDGFGLTLVLEYTDGTKKKAIYTPMLSETYSVKTFVTDANKTVFRITQSYNNGKGMYVKDVMIAYGSDPSYEPYIEPTTYQSTADGTVEGVKSISPNMTLLTNNNGVVINANYLRDIDTYIDNLITNVALTGGE